MQCEVARRVGRAGHSGQSVMPARRAKLLRCVLADLPAAVTPEDPRLYEGDTRKSGVEETASN